MKNLKKYLRQNDILSDKKRDLYDQFGIEGIEKPGMAGGMGMGGMPTDLIYLSLCLVIWEEAV